MADKFLQGSHKLYWHLKRVNDWMDGGNIAPVTIDMGINQVCNIACKFCYYGVATNQKSDNIPTEILLNFLTEASELGVRAVYFAGDGEPLLHPGVWDAVTHGKSQGLDMGISTNGLVIKPAKIQNMLEALTMIRFTLPGSQPDVYSEITGTRETTFHKVIRNIKKCVEIKNKHNLKVSIGIHMILIPDCAEDILPYARLGRDLGVDYAVIKQFSENSGREDSDFIVDYEKLEPIFKKAESYSTDTYSVIVKREKMGKFKRNYGKCYGCEFLTQISGNGDMYPCGNLYDNEEYFIGSILEKSFKEIIHGKRYREVMTKVNNVIDVQKDCGSRCRTNEINEFVWKLKQQPEHHNFI